MSGAPASLAGRARRLDTLTGLRFVAALLVFLRHAVGEPDSELLRSLAEPGAVGVSFFFLLSGFVLTWSAVEGDTRRRFYRRRAARILPAYYLA